MKKKDQQKKNTGRNAALVWRFLKGSKALYVLSILSAAVTALADMIEPQIFRMAVDNALGGKEASYAAPVMAIVNRFGGFAYLGQHIWMMAAAVIAVALVRVFSQYGFRVFKSFGDAGKNHTGFTLFPY